MTSRRWPDNRMLCEKTITKRRETRWSIEGQVKAKGKAINNKTECIDVVDVNNNKKAYLA